jgi:hypothetical protein
MRCSVIWKLASSANGCHSGFDDLLVGHVKVGCVFVCVVRPPLAFGGGCRPLSSRSSMLGVAAIWGA